MAVIGLVSTELEVCYVVIRYINYEAGVVNGDHLYLSLKEMYASTLSDYGVAIDDWRPLSAAEVAVINAQIQ